MPSFCAPSSRPERVVTTDMGSMERNRSLQLKSATPATGAGFD